jgi:WG containing repeat
VRLYSFSKERKQGFLTVAGKVAVRPSYDSTSSAGGNVYLGRKHNDWIYLDEHGKKLFSRQPPYVVEFGRDNIGATLRYDAKRVWCRAALIWPDGREVAIDGDDVWPPSEGLAAVRKDRGQPMPGPTSWWDDEGHGRFGYVDTKGAWKIEPTFAGAGPFVGGIAPAAIRKGKGRARWGAIDHQGAWVCQPTYARAHSAGEGLIAVADAKERWGLVSAEGVVVKPQFATGPVFAGGLAAARLGRGSAGVIDRAGDWVLEPTYADAGQPIEGVIPVATQGKTKQPKWGLVTREGRVVLKPTYMYLIAFGELFLWAGPYHRTTPNDWGYLAPATGDVLWSGTR